jgi:3-keto-5-aminohexanoate cleavage enzyme
LSYKPRKVIITVAICGGTTRKQTPHVPYSPEEIADSAIEARKAGAAISHIHVRDEKGKPTYEAAVYSSVIRRIREKSDIIINCTTGGPVYDERRKVLGVNPEMATLNCGSTNLGDRVMMNSNLELEKMSSEMLERKIKPEIMIHSQGFIQNAKMLMAKKLIEQPMFFNLFFASGGMEATSKNLLYLVEHLPLGSMWMATGHGVDAYPMAVQSILNGGHARIGLEDCIQLSNGQLAESNAQLVDKLVRIAHELDLEIATPKEARDMLKTTYRRYDDV